MVRIGIIGLGSSYKEVWVVLGLVTVFPSGFYGWLSELQKCKID